MKRGFKLFIATAALITFKTMDAQESKKIGFTTGIGINKIQGRLHQVFRSTVAFNSGLELALGKNWYAQAELNFNSLKYDQQKKADNSSYLFQNTNSSLLLLGLNGGKDFHLGKSGWFTSLYGGADFISVGEPRISIDEDKKIVTQTAARRSGIFGKAGGRFGVNTKSKIFQTLYIDGAYWLSSVSTQGASLKGISVFAGIKMSM